MVVADEYNFKSHLTCVKTTIYSTNIYLVKNGIRSYLKITPISLATMVLVLV